MRKIYITPKIVVAECIVESFIAATIKGGDSDVDGNTSEIRPGDDDDEYIQHSKQFTAWDAWDD